MEFLFTKIIATLGPASSDATIILKLIQQGVRIFRINFSHGAFEDYEHLLNNIRKAEKQSGNHIAVLGDLSGPKIRVGKVIKDGVRLQKGQEIEFVKRDVVTGEKNFEFVFSSTFPHFIGEVELGERILLDDGNVELKCTGRKGKGLNSALICEVINGGLITSAKGINLPDSDLSVPSMSAKDFLCTKFAVEKGFDYLALSFVRSGDDVKILKEELVKLGARPQGQIDTKGDMGFTEVSEGLKSFIPIISKIEKPQAIDNLEDIINETDGIMVARGDLGVEMDIAEVAVLQKKIIHMCQEHGRPVIVATQMLESMIHSAVPTRAEVSDVANAIFDGADAVMLSGETAVGKYPVEAVRMMNRVATKTNTFIRQHGLQTGTRMKQVFMNRTAALADGVRTIVEGIHPKFLVVWTNLGGSAVNLSQQRTAIPIIAFNDDQKRLRQLSLLYSIEPMYMKQPDSGSKFIESIDKILIDKKWASKGDPIVIVSGDPIQKPGITNRIVIHYIGESVEE
ncbi:MAG: pyruvate kinase [Bacteroidales bacterium]|nr:pyruvate kinase [Bacteroidales bacterium]